MKTNKFVLSAIAMWLVAFAGNLIAETPIGPWLTFDENNGDTLSIVEIYKDGNDLAGRVAKVFLRPHQGENGVCARCADHLQNQPIYGLMSSESQPLVRGEFDHPPRRFFLANRV